MPTRRRTQIQPQHVIIPSQPIGSITAPSQLFTPDPTLQQEAYYGTQNIAQTTTVQHRPAAIEYLRAIQAQALPAVAAGDLESGDVTNVGIEGRQILASMGIHHPNDAWQLYIDGTPLEIAEQRGYLKGVARYPYFGGTFYPDQLGTLADYIYTSPKRDPRVRRDQILADLQTAPDIAPYDEIRTHDIIQYLRYFGLGRGDAVYLTLQSPGAGVTDDLVRQIYTQEQARTPTDRALIHEQSRELVQARDRDQFLTTALKRIAFNSGVIPVHGSGTLAATYKKFAENKDVLQYFNKTSVADLTNYHYNVLRQKITDLVRQHELINDPEFELIPNVSYMAQELLTAAAVRIGKTRNPAIPTLAKIGATRPQNYNGLFFKNPLETGSDVRLTGTVKLSDNRSLKEAVAVLGVSPKFGFAPFGHEYADIDAARQFTDFNVFVRPPIRYVTTAFPVHRVERVNNDFYLTLINGQDFDKGKSTLWEARSRPKRDAILPLLEDGTNEQILQAFNQFAYDGSLCFNQTYQPPIDDATDQGLKKIYQSIAEFLQKYGSKNGTPRTIAVDRFVSFIQQELAQIPPPTPKALSQTEYYTRVQPVCQVHTIDHGKIHISQNTPIWKKIDRIWTRCSNTRRGRGQANPENCTAEKLIVTQNSTDNYPGSASNGASGINKLILRLSTLLQIQNTVSPLNKLVELSLTDAAGFVLKDDTATKHATLNDRVDALNAAKLNAKKPLKINHWKFTEEIEQRDLTIRDTI